MKTKHVIYTLMLMCTLTLSANKPVVGTVYDFTVNSIDGKPVKLSDYKGKVLLIVNTASKCGLTPQYEGLQQLYQQYKDKGLEILAFPCNQFMGQEPGTAEEIVKFCTLNYQVSFPIFEKTEVNGDHTSPLYLFLKSSLPLEGKNNIRWNFEKFLIDRNGIPVKRFSPKQTPKELVGDIENII